MYLRKELRCLGPGHDTGLFYSPNLGYMGTRSDIKFARRLLKLAELLEGLKPERFYFGTWAGKEDRPFLGKSDLSCGCSACALGWATQLPFAKKLGMKIVQNDYRGESGLYKYGVIALGHHEDVAWLASKVVFGTDQREFEILFMPQTQFVRPGMKLCTKESSAGHVAQNIRAYVADKYGYVGSSK